MSTYSEAPTFNLKVVVAETDLKPDTIRAWERRYGLPEPERTPGGHRLYSQRDIFALKWLMARKDEGLSISKAVKLWKKLEQEGRDPLQVMPIDARSLPEQPTTEPHSGSLNEMREAWIQACLGFDEAVAEQVAADAFAIYPLETVCINLFQRALSEIGHLWYQGEATPQQEHFASELAVRRLETLVSAAPSPHRQSKLLVGCSTDETHVFSPLLLVLLLRRRGWHVTYLGANVPLARLESTMAAVNPNMVVLTAQHLHAASTLQRMAEFIDQSGLRLGYGGLIFNRVPALRDRIPGEFLGENLSEAPVEIERLLGSPPVIPVVADRDANLGRAMDHYLDHQGEIAVRIWQNLQETGIDRADLLTATQYLGQGILAALGLGDLSYFEPDIQWVSGLVSNYSRNPVSLEQYLEAYRLAAARTLDEDGRPIIEWLARAATPN